VKILWVKPGKLLPLDSGGKLRTYNLVRHLSIKHDVTYLSYYNQPTDEAYENDILQHFPRAVVLPALGPKRAGVRRAANYLRHLPERAPYAVSLFASSQVRRMISEWITQRRFDVLICDFLASTPNFPSALTTPVVLFQHNVESVLWERRARFARAWATRLIATIECAKMARYEKRQVQRFNHVFAVSESDRQAMSAMKESSLISVIPTGVDLCRYRYDPTPRCAPPVVMFTGSMDWEPNIDAVEYFCREIWPQVLAKVPAAMFRIVGRDPHWRVKKLASRSVELTGTVESVVEHLREAAVLVVPLRMGGGTRIKIYEGMAMGRATVSTAVGAEGLDVHNGRGILLADEPREFADSVVMLLQDEDLRRHCETAAVAAVQQHDWSAIAEHLAGELQEVVLSGERLVSRMTLRKEVA